MNEITGKQRAARSFKFTAGRGAMVLLAALALTIAACDGGSSESRGSSGDFARTDVPVLNAVAYANPREALDSPSDPTLESHGDLLFSPTDVTYGFVDGDSWCDHLTKRCVEVSGDDPTEFGGEPLEAFVLEPDYRGDPSIEVVELRAMQHPVSDELRMVLEVTATDNPWAISYEPAQATSESGEAEVRLDGPEKVEPGLVTRYEIMEVDGEIAGPTKLVVTFTDDAYDGETVQVSVSLDVSAPDIERSKVPLGETPPVVIYRSSEPLPESDGEEDDRLAVLIDAIVDGSDTSELVAENSVAADVAKALGGQDSSLRPRRDPNDESALCWEAAGQGRFCERWHGAITEGDRLTSWSVEGVSLDDLVVTRVGSLATSSTTLVRSALRDLVFVKTEVTNDTAGELSISLYRPQAQRGDLVYAALTGSGAYSIEQGATETATALIAAPDLEFDLVYPQSLRSGGDDLRFDVDAPAAQATTSAASSEDLDPKSVMIASLLNKQRYDDAVAEAAPGSPAAEYLSAVAEMFPETRLYIYDGDEPIGSKSVCALGGSQEVCTLVEVTSVDDEGRAETIEIDGVDTHDLLMGEKETQRDDFTAGIDTAILWPKFGVFVSWTITNDSDSDVYLESVTLVDPDGVITEPKGSIFEELPAHRSITGVEEFDADSLVYAVEFRGTGRDAVRSVTLAVPLGAESDAVESDVELEPAETEFETHAGTELVIPGAWSEMIWYDEETNIIAGDNTPLRRVKSVYRDGMVLLAFSPEFSPVELSSDALVSEISVMGEVTDVETESTTTIDGEPVDLITAKIDFLPDPSRALIIPGEQDLILFTYEEPAPDDIELYAAAGNALIEQSGIVVPG